MTNYSIDDATGTLLCAGLQGDVVAYRTAQRLANERGELVPLVTTEAPMQTDPLSTTDRLAAHGLTHRPSRCDLVRLTCEEDAAVYAALAAFVENEREAVEYGADPTLLHAAEAVLGRMDAALAALAGGAS